MNRILEVWNNETPAAAVDAMLSCCAAHRWAEGVSAHRPVAGEEDMFALADGIWSRMGESDWMEAFRAHPRIGERKAAHASLQSTVWSKQEQASAESAQADVLAMLEGLNAAYEQRFGFTYIVCATGKSADEMLHILERRMGNDRVAELQEAAEQQRQIMQIRLGKWLHP